MALAQVLTVLAYKQASPSKLSPFNYSVVVFSALIGWVVWQEVPNLLTWVGVLLVAAGGILSTHGTPGGTRTWTFTSNIRAERRSPDLPLVRGAAARGRSFMIASIATPGGRAASHGGMHGRRARARGAAQGYLATDPVPVPAVRGRVPRPRERRLRCPADERRLGFNAAVYGFGAGIFFVGYFLFEIPSNLILQRVGARFWIARIMVSWGIVAVAMALVRDERTFYFLRFLLGVAEAGFFRASSLPDLLVSH